MNRSKSVHRVAVRAAVVVAVIGVTAVGLVGPAAAHGGGDTIVRPGQSIQGAIDAADPGDRIVVRAGTYREQLTIDKDGISLVGFGAILVPPLPSKDPVVNTCSRLADDGTGDSTEAGICVTGSDVTLAPFLFEHRKIVSVGRRVKDVSITGFQVRGFSGENIAVVGAQNARIVGNTLVDGVRYGFLTVGSMNTRVAGNSVTSTTVRYIAVCMDDVSGVKVSNNQISGYIFGFCVQTPGADVRNNVVSDSCIGVFVDPFIDGAKVRDNRISAANSLCASVSDFGAIGIIVDGAVNTVVRHNRIEGQTLGDLSNKFGVGIAVVDDQTTAPVAVSSGNVVTRNSLRNNDVDLFVATAGTDNVVKRNNCTSSSPDGLCTGR